MSDQPIKYGPADDILITTLRRKHVSFEEIAEHLGHRTGRGVRRRHDILLNGGDKRKPKKETRKCLGPCGRTFKSAGKHNRICPSCKEWVEEQGCSIL